MVQSEPAGAEVTVNGESRGTTPLELLDLPLGVYELSLRLKGYEPVTREASLTAAAPDGEVDVALSRHRPSPKCARCSPASGRRLCCLSFRRWWSRCPWFRCLREADSHIAPDCRIVKE